MKEKILNYLKRTGLFFIAHPLSHWLGVVISGVIGVIAAFILKEDYTLYAAPIEYVCLFIFPFLSLFVMVFYFTGYDESARFSPKAVIASLVPLFVAQWVYLFIWGPAFWINGNCALLSFLLFPEYQLKLWPDIVILLGLQLFVYLPIYFFASHCGYIRKEKEESYSE